MRHRVDELLRIINQSVANCIAPEVFRLLELLKNLDRLGNVDLTVLPNIGSVAQFADAGMSRTGVVPTVGALLRQILGNLI